jgi:hypothetical protein
MPKADYLAALRGAGFEDVWVAKEKELEVPEDLLAAYLTAEQRKSVADSGMRVLSVTVQGRKPEKQNASCCTPLASAGEGPCCHPAK